MTEYQDIINIIALSMGAAWASGINLYAAILMLGVMGISGDITLPPDLQVLASPIVIAAAGLMYMVEFTADKIPGVDNSWDALHTLIRVPAGAVLAGAAVGDVSSAASLAAAIVGGGVALSTHAAKSGSRVMINTSPEPVSNWTASIGEDLAVFAGLWAALHHPIIFLFLFILFMLFLVWALPKLWQLIKSVFGKIRNWFSQSSTSENHHPPGDNRNPKQEELMFKMDSRKK